MAPARKVYTEAMIRRVFKAHYEIESAGTHDIHASIWCECGFEGRSDSLEDHFIDQLHKLWHEMFGLNPNTHTTTLLSTPVDPHTIVEVNA